MKIGIVFENKKRDEFELFWELEKTPISYLWLKKILKIFNNKFEVKSRWTGFEDLDYKKDILIEKLKKCITIINACEYIDYKIPYLTDQNYTTDMHNMYHHHFEILMGKTWNNSVFLKEILKRNDKLVLDAISGLNEFSHEINDYKFSFPNITVEFLSKNKINNFIPDCGDNYFTLENHFGGLYLHYAQIGKNWLDFLMDDDEVITKNQVETLKIINGEFDICFLNNILIGQEKYNELFDLIKNKLEKLDENINDKKLRLGRVLIAKPLFLEEKEIFNKIKIFSKIKRMSFIGKRKTITRDFIHNEVLI